MENRTNHRGVTQQVSTIRRQFWYVLAASSGPFLILAIASVLNTDTSSEKLLFAATFIFGFGLALIASKVASHAAIERHLNNILRIDKVKSEFISTAAHQLKTPVSAFSYSLEAFAVALEKKDEEAMRDFVNDLRTSVNRMKLLTGNLLDMTLIENEEVKVNPEKFQIKNFIEETAEEFKPLAKTQEQSLETKILTEEAQIAYCDKTLLYNVLENLISNAFKYGAPKTNVELRLEKQGEELLLSITNKTKLPITKRELKEIFLRFSEGTAGKNSQSEGFGLGLSICKAYVESWGGQIEAKLKSPKEITFSFTIPTKEVEVSTPKTKESS